MNPLPTQDREASYQEIAAAHAAAVARLATAYGAPTCHTLRALRGELEKQRVLLATVGRWYVAPIAACILLGRTALEIDSGHPDWPGAALYFLFASAFCLFVVWLNVRGARKLAEEIRAIDDSVERP